MWVHVGMGVVGWYDDDGNGKSSGEEEGA